MSTQFYSVATVGNEVQNTMGRSHLHTPQSVFQPTMNYQNDGLHNEARWLGMSQVPPVSMPWAIPSSQQPDLVYFTGRQKSFAVNKGSVKRRLETPDLVDLRPTKQLITEEKMAQHFSGLHISPNAECMHEAGPSTSAINGIQNLQQSNSIDLDLINSLDSNKSNDKPRLVISDELKRIQHEPILPASLLTQSISKLERPSMALVLWEPPSKHLHFLPRDSPTPTPSDDNNNNNNNNNNSNNHHNSMNTDNASNNDSNSSNNNNNESIPDLNQTMEINISNTTLEPMDL